MAGTGIQTGGRIGNLIYVGDPMCSWCYGIAEEVSIVKQAYKGTLGFTLLLGGLRPGGMEKISSMADFLRPHWEKVTSMSGQTFDYAILGDPDLIVDTEPGCRAVRTVRELAPELEFEFFKRIQIAFYQQNKSLLESKTFTEICDDMGISSVEFESLFHQDALREATARDFEVCRQLGVRSFPTILLERQGNLEPIAFGFARSGEMISVLEKLLPQAGN